MRAALDFPDDEAANETTPFQYPTYADDSEQPLEEEQYQDPTDTTAYVINQQSYHYLPLHQSKL